VSYGDGKTETGERANSLEGITHRGFALIDILQPCVSFNHKNTYSWYRERVYKLENEDGYDPSDEGCARKGA